MKANQYWTASGKHPSPNRATHPTVRERTNGRGLWHLIPLLLLLLAGAARAMVPVPPGTNMLLCSWSFADTNTWFNDNGYAPLSFTNITGSAFGIGPAALVMDSPNPAWLRYNCTETDGSGISNLTVQVGTVMLWFAPNWTSTNQGGTGPGQWGRFMEVGSYTTNASYGWWCLYTDSGGGNLYFSAQDASGDQATFLSCPISWGSSNAWHHLALTYSSTNTSLYLDGFLATNGAPVTVWPGSAVLSNGFTIGSDASTGMAQVHGTLDEVSAYNFEVDSGTIGADYLNGQMALLMNPNNVGNFSSATSSPAIFPTFNVLTGNGNLTSIATNGFCVTNSNIWLTNVSAAPFGTNGAMSVTFTIEGGSNGVPYDVFATSYLQTGTDTQWAWMGQGYQCVTYMLTNLPSPWAYVILGFPTDSDGDGLTDAYEVLVSHTNPHKPDTSGDGMLDGWKVMWGLNPLINNTTQTGSRNNYTYDGTGRLETLSGILAEMFNFDPEGNIQLDQP